MLSRGAQLTQTEGAIAKRGRNAVQGCSSGYLPHTGLRMRLSAAIAFVLCMAMLSPGGLAQSDMKGRPCGGPGGAECGKGLWCEPSAGSCKSAYGICVAVPKLCVARKKSKSFQPVCGCNGKTYSNDCFRRAYRVAKFRDGKC